MNSGSKLRAWVSFHITLLSSESFKKIGGGKLMYSPCKPISPKLQGDFTNFIAKGFYLALKQI